MLAPLVHFFIGFRPIQGRDRSRLLHPIFSDLRLAPRPGCVSTSDRRLFRSNCSSSAAACAAVASPAMKPRVATVIEFVGLSLQGAARVRASPWMSFGLRSAAAGPLPGPGVAPRRHLLELPPSLPPVRAPRRAAQRLGMLDAVESQDEDDKNSYSTQGAATLSFRRLVLQRPEALGPATGHPPPACTFPERVRTAFAGGPLPLVFTS